MKRVITFLMLAVLGMMLVTGCHASGSIGNGSTSISPLR